MKINCFLASCLALLTFITLNPQLSTAHAQSAGYTNWDNLINGWVQTSAPTNQNWRGVASSADGNKLVAVAYGDRIYNSTNAGATWTLTSAPGAYWGTVASSADGNKLVAGADNSGNGWNFTSTNAGASWTQISAPGGAWNSVASSANGNKLVAADRYGAVYTSANSGDTWTQTDVFFGNWQSVAASADGTQLMVAGQGGIYLSQNSGVTWTLAGDAGITWRSIASSADGNKLVAGAMWGGIYTTTNSGSSWRQTSTPNSFWYSIASSADGAVLAAANSDGDIYVSMDSGDTWTKTVAPEGNWYSIASSADGNALVAVMSGGGIWTAQATPVPPGATPYTNDANTVLLDHFDGTTVAAKVAGALNYVSGPSGLDQAADFSDDGWLRYNLAPWSSTTGTIEAWICPTNVPAMILTMQWFNSDTPPGSGYVLSATVNADGKITAGSWPGGSITGNGVVPLNTWTHVAITWSPSGSAIYLNGVLDASTTSALYPQMLNPTYVYVGSWGAVNPLAMDELRISNTQRTNFNVMPPRPPTLTNTINSTTVASGGSITLTAGVSGTPPFTYQWFFNRAPIAGATNATLTITNFSPSDVGNYRVTVSNASGSVTGPTVTLSMMDIKMFAGIVVNGPVGSAYTIQAKTGLSEEWATLATITLPTQPYIFIDYDSQWNSQRFYRAVPLQ